MSYDIFCDHTILTHLPHISGYMHIIMNKKQYNILTRTNKVLSNETPNVQKQSYKNEESNARGLDTHKKIEDAKLAKLILRRW